MAKARGQSIQRSTPKKRMVGWTPARRATFLACVAQGWTISAAAAEVKLTRDSAYKLKARDAAFSAAWDAAYKESTELLEAEAFQRAVGREEPVVDKKGNVHYIKKYSDLLLIFLLKARDPKKYRDQLDVNVREHREILVNLVPLVKAPDGRLVLKEDADVDVTPLLAAGGADDDTN